MKNETTLWKQENEEETTSLCGWIKACPCCCSKCPAGELSETKYTHDQAEDAIEAQGWSVCG